VSAEEVPEERAHEGGGGRPEEQLGDITAVVVEASASVGRNKQPAHVEARRGVKAECRAACGGGAARSVKEERRRTECDTQVISVVTS
jgi:hypothetical protein